jgi:hypothetical protein
MRVLFKVMSRVLLLDKLAWVFRFLHTDNPNPAVAASMKCARACVRVAAGLAQSALSPRFHPALDRQALGLADLPLMPTLVTKIY